MGLDREGFPLGVKAETDKVVNWGIKEGLVALIAYFRHEKDPKASAQENWQAAEEDYRRQVLDKLLKK